MLFLFKQLPSELSPTEDRGVIVSIGIGPEGSTPAYFDKYAKQVEGIYAKYLSAFYVFNYWFS
jgi:multidrug efflux pump